MYHNNHHKASQYYAKSLELYAYSNKKKSKFQLWCVESLSFSKINEDLWGVSANVNNLFGLFATHSFTNSSSKQTGPLDYDFMKV